MHTEAETAFISCRDIEHPMILKVINSGSKGNGYALYAEDEILLIECGVPAKEMLKTIDYRTGHVCGCVVSHSHRDHAGYVKQYMNYGIKVYSSEHVAADVMNVYEKKITALKRMKSYKIGSFNVVPFRVPHDDTECDGWLIRYQTKGNLLFMTDLEYCPYNFSGWDINYLLTECNYSDDYVLGDEAKREHVLRGHMELETCKRLVQAIKSDSLTSIGLLHLSAENADPERFAREIKELVLDDVEVWVAKKGFQAELYGEL